MTARKKTTTPKQSAPKKKTVKKKPTLKPAAISQKQAQNFPIVGIGASAGGLEVNEYLLNILESITDAFVSIDHNWHYTYVNHSAAKLLGKTQEQMLGKVLWDVFPEVKDSQFGKEFRRAVAQNVPVHFEAFYLPHNAWYECHVYPSNGGLSIFFTNINERKETQEKIKDLSKFPSENPFPVLRLANDGTILYSNTPGRVLLDEWHCEKGQKAPKNWRAIIKAAIESNHYREEEISCGEKFFLFIVTPVAATGYANLYGLDITERKQAERALKESQEDLNHAQSVGGIGSWRLDIRKNELTWSDENHHIFGIPKEMPMTYETFLSTIHPDDRDSVDAQWKAALAGKNYDIEHRIVVNGELKWVREKAYLEFDENHEIVSGFGITHDITQRKEMELRRALTAKILACFNRESGGMERVRDVVALIKEYLDFDAIGIRLREGDDFPFFETNGFPSDFVKTENYLCARDESGKILYDAAGQPALECMCGNVLSGRTDPEFPVFTEDGSFWTNGTTELLKSGLPKKYQSRTRNRCYRAGYESVALIPLRSDREIVGMLQFNDTLPGRFTPELIRFLEGIGATIGIAIARIRAEQNILKLNQELEERVFERTVELEEVNKNLLWQIEYRRKLEKEILLIGERAQRLIGQELHDDIGQLFAGTALMLKALQKKITDVLPEEVSYLEKIMKLVDQAIDHTKRMSRGLAPMNLEADNLVVSLRELAAGAEGLGIHCTVRGDGSISLTDAAMALNLYRIAQEAMNNAIKHGKAKTIQIELTCDSDRSTLTVESDGLDFPEVLPESKGMGLKIMQYRSELINGSLDVHRGVHGGTIVTCVAPNQNSE